MGVTVREVDAPNTLGDVLEEALAAGGPWLINVRVDGSISPPLGDRARTIAGFKDR